MYFDGREPRHDPPSLQLPLESPPTRPLYLVGSPRHFASNPDASINASVAKL
jgi:hypothetical protein